MPAFNEVYIEKTVKVLQAEQYTLQFYVILTIELSGNHLTQQLWKPFGIWGWKWNLKQG